MKKLIDDAIFSLKYKLLLEREEDVAGVFGIQIKCNIDEGTVTLTQTGLIDSILEIMGLEESNHKYTPADKVPYTKILMIPHE